MRSMMEGQVPSEQTLAGRPKVAFPSTVLRTVPLPTASRWGGERRLSPHSSVRISTVSPMRRKRTNGPQAASKGG